MKDLGIRALEFARSYRVLVDALVKEGVPEMIAREEARYTAGLLFFESGETGKTCPLCGKGMDVDE